MLTAYQVCLSRSSQKYFKMRQYPILREARANGINDTFVALIERIYHNQQELSRNVMQVSNGIGYLTDRITKRIDQLEEKVDPEAATKRKEERLDGAKCTGQSMAALGTL